VADGCLVQLVAVAVHDIDRRHDHAWSATAALRAKIAAEGPVSGAAHRPGDAPMVVTLEPAACPISTAQELTACRRYGRCEHRTAWCRSRNESRSD
jgi:hypothetical protein